MSKFKDIVCQLVPDEVALKTFYSEIRYKNIPERLGCSKSEKPTKETCFNLTRDVSLCIVEGV
jgi:hypothetical protein